MIKEYLEVSREKNKSLTLHLMWSVRLDSSFNQKLEQVVIAPNLTKWIAVLAVVTNSATVHESSTSIYEVRHIDRTTIHCSTVNNSY